VKRIGIREFKNHSTRILKGVREEGARYVITHHGRPAAIVLPIDPALPADASDADLDRNVQRSLSRADLRSELEALRLEVDQSWRADESAVEVISGQRR
jgi:prevent-host-death family protein